jgi:hypothetical protein
MASFVPVPIFPRDGEIELFIEKCVGANEPPLPRCLRAVKQSCMLYEWYGDMMILYCRSHQPD